MNVTKKQNQKLREALTQAKVIKEPISKVKGSMYNSWRSKVYTQKGKKIGFPDSWCTFEKFKEEMSEGWELGKILKRVDQTKPYSKENCYWADKGTEEYGKLVTLTYNGETKTLAEWCVQYNQNYNGMRQRYFRGKNYTPEQIIFGKIAAKRRAIMSIDELSDEQKKRDKISKMLSSYRLKDKKHGRKTSLTNDELRDIVENSCCIYCGDVKRIGLDRIDNNKGHTIDNVVPCCYECNVARGNNFTYEEMLIIGKSIREVKENRNRGVKPQHIKIV